MSRPTPRCGPTTSASPVPPLDLACSVIQQPPGTSCNRGLQARPHDDRLGCGRTRPCHPQGVAVRRDRLMSLRDRLMLLDTPSLYFRAFHGVPTTVTAPDGSPVNAVRGLSLIHISEPTRPY